jgi:hypothetical protein
MFARLAMLAVCAVLLPWSVSAREQAGSMRESSAPTREHLANTRKLPLSRLLGLCGDVKKLMALNGELGKRPLSQEDIYVVSSGTKCLAATAAIIETIRVMAPMYQERLVCLPPMVKDQDLVSGFIEWAEDLNRRGGDDVFRLSAPQAFIVYIRKAYPCAMAE